MDNESLMFIGGIILGVISIIIALINGVTCSIASIVFAGACFLVFMGRSSASSIWEQLMAFVSG